MEINEIMDRAKDMSKLFENNDMAKIINLLKLVNQNNTQKQKEQDLQRDKTSQMSLLNIENSNIKSLKAVIPYLDMEYKGKISNIINFMEINNLLRKYKEEYPNLDYNRRLDLKKEAISYIRPQVNEENKPMIDVFIKAMEISNILNNNYYSKER